MRGFIRNMGVSFNSIPYFGCTLCDHQDLHTQPILHRFELKFNRQNWKVEHTTSFAFVPTSQIEHNQLLSMTAAHTSLIPFLWCSTGLCIGPDSVHPLHKTSFWHHPVSLRSDFSLSPLHMTLNSMTLLLHWTIKRPYLPCKPAFLMSSPGC